MIVLDTSIVSSFAIAGELDLLLELFANHELGVTPAVYAELSAGPARAVTRCGTQSP